MTDTPKKPPAIDLKSLKDSVSTTNHRLSGRPEAKSDPQEVRGSVSTTNHLLRPPTDRKK